MVFNYNEFHRPSFSVPDMPDIIRFQLITGEAVDLSMGDHIFKSSIPSSLTNIPQQFFYQPPSFNNNGNSAAATTTTTTEEYCISQGNPTDGSFDAVVSVKKRFQRKLSTIVLFGILESGSSIALMLHDHRPYFLIEAPHDIPKSQQLMRVRTTIESFFQVEEHPIIHSVIFVDRQNMFGACHLKLPYIKVSFYSNDHRRRSIRRFNEFSGAFYFPGSRFPYFDNRETGEATLFHADERPENQYFFDRKLTLGRWVTVSRSSIEWTSDEFQQHYFPTVSQSFVVLNNEALEPLPSTDPLFVENAPQRYLFFDIECLGRGNQFPKPQVQSDIPFLLVGYAYDTKFPNDIHCLVFFVDNTLYHSNHSPVMDTEPEEQIKIPSSDPPEYMTVRTTIYRFQDCRQMLLDFKQFLDAFDLDAFVGHNIVSFDIPYLINYARAIGIQSEFCRIGRFIINDQWMNEVRRVEVHTRAYGHRSYDFCSLRHVKQIDTLNFAHKEIMEKQPSYRLGALGEKFLGVTKELVTYDKIKPLYYTATKAAHRLLVIYCKKDALITFFLFNDWKIDLVLWEQCKATGGVHPEDLLLRGMGLQGQTKIARRVRQTDYCVPTFRYKGSKNQKYDFVSLWTLENDLEEQMERRMMANLNNPSTMVPNNEEEEDDTAAVDQQQLAVIRNISLEAPVLPPSADQPLQSLGDIEPRPFRLHSPLHYHTNVEPWDGKFIGATVIQPQTGYYDSPTLVFDFSSLYPCCASEGNMCWTTVLLTGQHPKFCRCHLTQQRRAIRPLFPYAEMWSQKNSYRAASGVYFLKPPARTTTTVNGIGDDINDDGDHNYRRRGLLPQIIDDGLVERNRLKKEKANAPTKKLKTVYEGAQTSQKRGNNSLYGYTTDETSQLYCTEIGASITARGREALQQTQVFILQYLSQTVRFVVRGLYGDTDSVMIMLEGCTISEGMEIGQQWAPIISKLFGEPMKILFEKMFIIFLLFKKKRYAGLHLEYDDYKKGKPAKVNLKGLQIVRRDHCLWNRETARQCVEKALMTDKLSPLLLKNASSITWEQIHELSQQVKQEIFQILEKAAYQLYMNHVDFSKLVFTKGYAKTIESYKSPQPHTLLIERMLERDPMYKVSLGDRIPYIYRQRGTKRELQSSLAEDPQWMIEKALLPDFDYYLNHELFQTTFDLVYILTKGQRLDPPGFQRYKKKFDPFYVEVQRYHDSVKSRLPKILTSYRRTLSTEKQGGQEQGGQGIARYFKVKEQCFTCAGDLIVQSKGRSMANHQQICSECRRETPLKRQRLSEFQSQFNDQLQEVQKDIEDLQQQCKACQGENYNVLKCTRSECGIFFTRYHRKDQRSLITERLGELDKIA